jgi:putative transposase
MTAHRYLDMMQLELGVTSSHSRPRVSNDNPHIESGFRTLKYQPDYPGRFYGVIDAKQWCEDYFKWYNFEHRHVGLSGFTPQEVFSGDYKIIQKRKQIALSAFYEKHPERFVRGLPKAKVPPAIVAINPYTEDELMSDIVEQVNFPTLSYLK